jgi:hypothetical protein
MLLDEARDSFLFRLTILCRESLTNVSTRSDKVGPRNTELTVTAVPLINSARPRERDSQLRGFSRTVLNHLPRNVQRGFRRDENDTAPITLESIPFM